MSSSFKHIAVFILALLLFAAETASLTLYTAGSCAEEAILEEINENIDLDALAEKYVPENEYTDFDVISTIKFLSRLLGFDILNGIETTEDFVKALLKTEAMTSYMTDFSTEMLEEAKNGNTDVSVDSEKLSKAVVSGITELFGVEIAENSQIRSFAERAAKDYIDNMIEGKDNESMLEEFGVTKDSLATLKTLTSEKSRRVSVAVCATIAVLMFILCRRTGNFGFSAGLPTAASGALFLTLGIFAERFAIAIRTTESGYLASIIETMQPLSEKWGGIVLAVGAALLLIGSFFSKSKREG